MRRTPKNLAILVIMGRPCGAKLSSVSTDGRPNGFEASVMKLSTYPLFCNPDIRIMALRLGILGAVVSLAAPTD